EGDARAMNAIGLWNIEGNCIEKDEPAGIDLLKQAADLGEPAAMFNLARRYAIGSDAAPKNPEESAEYFSKAIAGFRKLADAGEGVAGDAVKAHEWRLKAADAGLPVAMFLVGRDYEFGSGVGKDADEAWRWCRKAALRGNAPALTRLGIDAMQAQELNEAVKHFEAAAALGNASAFYHLGVLYAHGRGVKKDENHAAELYRRGAEAGDPAAM